jgi:hypothetical protein
MPSLIRQGPQVLEVVGVLNRKWKLLVSYVVWFC